MATHKMKSTRNTDKLSVSEIIIIIVLVMVGGGILFVVYEFPQYWSSTLIYTAEAPNKHYKLSFITHGFQDRTTYLFIEQGRDVHYLLTFDPYQDIKDYAFYWINQGEMFSFAYQGHEEFYDSDGTRIADISKGYGQTRTLIVEEHQSEPIGKYLWRIQERKYRATGAY